MKSEPPVESLLMIKAWLELVISQESLAAASRRLGKSRNYFSRMRERGIASWLTYYEYIASHGISDLMLTTWAHSVEPYPALAPFGDQALDLALRREPAPIKQIRAAYLRGELPAGDAGYVRRGLQELDDLRYSDPAKAEAQVRELVRKVDNAGFAARALGVWASAQRMVNDLDGAHTTLWTAIRIAGTEKQHEILGDLVQRAVYVLSDRGEFMRGHELACVAYELFEGLGDRDRMGRALVDLGTMLWRAGEKDRSFDAMELALEYLDSSSNRHRFTALMATATVLVQRGELGQAEELVSLARKCCPTTDYFQARLFWLRARLSAASGDTQKADQLYGRAMSAVGQEAPIDLDILVAERIHLLSSG